MPVPGETLSDLTLWNSNKDSTRSSRPPEILLLEILVLVGSGSLGCIADRRYNHSTKKSLTHTMWNVWRKQRRFCNLLFKSWLTEEWLLGFERLTTYWAAKITWEQQGELSTCNCGSKRRFWNTHNSILEHFNCPSGTAKIPESYGAKQLIWIANSTSLVAGSKRCL